MRLTSRIGNAITKLRQPFAPRVRFGTPTLNRPPVSSYSIPRTFQSFRVIWRTYATPTPPPEHRDVKSFEADNIENTDAENESVHPAMQALLDKDYQKAIELFQRDLLWPNLPSYHKRQCLFNLGASYFAQSTYTKTSREGLYESAIKYLTDCLEVPWDQEWESKDEYDATTGHAHSNIGAIEIQRLGPQKAIPDDVVLHFTKAAELCPQDGQIHYNLATVLLREARIEDAVKELEKSAELGVDTAREKLNEIHKRLGEIDNQ